LQGLDDSERVIDIGTLNKALFPGLRLGYAVVPGGYCIGLLGRASSWIASRPALSTRSRPPF